MATDEKILQTIAGLQQAVEKQGRSLESLQEGQKAIQTGQQALHSTVAKLGEISAGLQEGQRTLELKVEAFHTEQIRANEEVMEHLIESDEINGGAQRQLEKEVD